MKTHEFIFRFKFKVSPPEIKSVNSKSLITEKNKAGKILVRVTADKIRKKKIRQALAEKLTKELSQKAPYKIIRSVGKVNIKLCKVLWYQCGVNFFDVATKIDLPKTMKHLNKRRSQYIPQPIIIQPEIKRDVFKKVFLSLAALFPFFT